MTPEILIDEFEELLTAAVSEAEDLLTELAIEMSVEAKVNLLGAASLPEEFGEQQQSWPTNTSANH
jgi:hypothetical protein